MAPAEDHSRCDAPMCVRNHRELTSLDVYEPALANAILVEPCDALLRFANSWIRRQHFDDEIRCAADPIADNPGLWLRNEDEIRLDDQRTLVVENHVERREPHFPDVASANVRVKSSKQTGDD